MVVVLSASPRISRISRMLQCFKIRVIRSIRVVYLSPRISRISRMQLFFKIRVIRAIRVVYLSPRISRISRMLLCFKIRVIRAIRGCNYHHSCSTTQSVLFRSVRDRRCSVRSGGCRTIRRGWLRAVRGEPIRG